MKLYTIGSLKCTAEQFFAALKASGAVRVVDVRCTSTGYTHGFANSNDLPYLLQALCNMEYTHLPALGPTRNLLSSYKAGTITWAQYEEQFIELLQWRRIEKLPIKHILDNAVLLCFENDALHCHRRLVAEYLAQHWAPNVSIEHLQPSTRAKQQLALAEP